MRRFVFRPLKRIIQSADAFRTSGTVLLILGAALYAIFRHTPQELFDGSFPIAIFLAFVSYGFFLIRWSLVGRPRFTFHLILLPLIYLPILIVVATAIYYGIWVTLRDGYLWLEHQSPSRGFFVALVGVAVVIAGCALFFFRLRARFFFGLTEAVAGLLIAIHKVPADADPAQWSSETFLLILTAGVFLIVRGFDNMHTGLKSEPQDAILRTLSESEYGDLLRSPRGDDNKS